MLTMSPATMPWASARWSRPPRRSTRRPGHGGLRPRRGPRRPTTSSSAARTARSASSSCATGVPHTAMTASPMNFSITPPWRPTDLPGEVEVASQHLPRVLGVALLGGRGEPDQVDEQDGHEPSLRDRLQCHRGADCQGVGRCGCRCLTRSRQRGPAFAAELRCRGILGAAHRAGAGETMSALHAELPIRFVLGAAIGAGQHGRGASNGSVGLIRRCSIRPIPLSGKPWR